MKFGPARIGAFLLVAILALGAIVYFATRDEPAETPMAFREAPVEKSPPNSGQRVANQHFTSAWATAMASKVRLESAQTAIGDGHLVFGLHMVMDRGWMTYWRNPGDAGFAPRFNWSGSQNLKSINLLWPAPRAFDEMGERDYGYRGDLIWPLKVTVDDPEKPLNLALTLDYGICSDVCVPAQVSMRLELPTGMATETAQASAINQAIARVPTLMSQAGLSAKVRLGDIEGHRAILNISLEGQEQGSPAELVIVTGPQGSYFGASQPTGPKGFHVPLDAAAPEALRGQRLSLLFLSENGDWAREGYFVVE